MEQRKGSYNEFDNNPIELQSKQIKGGAPMAKHKRVWNESQYRRYLAEGRGQGTMETYKPWVQIQDFPSKGIVSRVKGRKTGRVHHLMSNLELGFFYLLDWSEITSDIREQYPLDDIADAISVAEEAGIRYPYDKSSGFPYVMTSDFLITKHDEMVARAVKPSSELKKPRVREKLEIERRYWQRRGVSWKLVTEKEIPRTKVRNIEWLCSGMSAYELIADERQRAACAAFFIELYENADLPLAMILQRVEHDFDLVKGTGISVFKMLICEKKIVLNLDEEIDLTRTGKQAFYGQHLYQ